MILAVRLKLKHYLLKKSRNPGLREIERYINRRTKDTENYVTGRIRGARLSYYATKFETYKTDVKETWMLLNSVIKPKKSNVKINKLIIIIDDNIITDQQEVCNSLNEYFASVGSGIA